MYISVSTLCCRVDQVTDVLHTKEKHTHTHTYTHTPLCRYLGANGGNVSVFGSIYAHLTLFNCTQRPVQ